MSDINIAIIEDNDEYRERFKTFCEQSKRLECVFAVSSTEKFIKYFSSIIEIDIILVDLSLPGLDGFNAIKHIIKATPKTEIIVLTAHEDYDSTFKALKTGAIGYLIKKLSLIEIEEYIIDFVDKGKIPLSPQIARRILQYFQPRSLKIDVNTSDSVLTSKEILVVKHIINGRSYDEIASLMGISINGVRYHIKNIYKKLYIRSKGELMNLFSEGFFKKYFR